MAVPEFRGYYPSEEDMGNEQLCFYKALEEALNQGKHLDVQGNIGYVFVYLYKLLGNWNKAGFEDLYQYLIYVSELYTAEKKLSDYCKFWAYDCLLGLNRFDDYLESRARFFIRKILSRLQPAIEHSATHGD